MNLSSKTTYFFPFIILYLPSLFFIHLFFGKSTNLDILLYFAASILTIIFFFAFKKSVGFFSKHKNLKYLLILLPLVATIIVKKHFEFETIIVGLLLLFSFSVFSNRYVALLTDSAIKYKNLLGQTGEIDLKNIVKLEQKSNVLSLFRTYRHLDAFIEFPRKTVITFVDENIDECEIKIFTKTLKAEALFSSIIDNAHKCGNLKIRQYAF